MNKDSFVRLPTAVLEAFLCQRLSGTDCRILLWIIRQTYGWNRRTAPFTWYRIAKDLTLDRGGVVRAGQRLVRSGFLRLEHGQASIFEDWPMTNVSDDGRHRKAMTDVTASDDKSHRNRCQASSLFRRAKDRCKDNLKTYKDRRTGPQAEERAYPTAGAAMPIPGKYDRLS